MEDRMQKVDKILDNLIELAYDESKRSLSKNFFSKDLAEACGIIISLSYGRFDRNDK